MSKWNGKKTFDKKKNGAWGRKNFDDRMINKIDRQKDINERIIKTVDKQTVKLKQFLERAVEESGKQWVDIVGRSE